MNRILSQAELDALLAVQTDSPAGRRTATAAASVARYNFRRPDRVSKDQIHALQFLHERCAQTIATSLSAYLRTTISLSVASVEQLSYAEFLHTVADPTAFYSIAVTPAGDLGAIEINPSVAFAVLDRMLGGIGQVVAGNRALTEIEQNVLDGVARRLLAGLADAWKAVADLAFTISARETRPQMLQVAGANDMMVSVVFDARVGDVRGVINLCLPTEVAEIAGTHFSRMGQRQQRELTAEEYQNLRESLGRVPIPLTPQITTHLPAGTVVALAVGEIVALPLPADQPLDVYAGGVRKFTGRLASEHGRLMVSIQDRCERESQPVGGV